MTTYVEARDALVGLINTAWTTGYPGRPVFYENTLSIDLDTVPSGYLRVEIEFQDSIEASLDLITRTFGVMYCTLFVKTGTGTREVLGMMDYLTNVARFVTTNKVTLGHQPQGQSSTKEAKKGWVGYELIVPFQFNSLT